jgi:hypothetical protein
MGQVHNAKRTMIARSEDLCWMPCTVADGTVAYGYTSDCLPYRGWMVQW